MNTLAITLAWLSAATFALSTSAQHFAAQDAPSSVRGAVRLVGYLLGRPSWLVGQVLAVAGFALHALALQHGPIAVVQPIVISGIVLAVPARAAISRRLPSAREVRAVALTALGLAVFLVASNPTSGVAGGLGGRPLTFVAAGVLLAVVVALAARLTDRPDRRALLFGATSGVLFGLVAGLLKLTIQTLAQDGVWRMLVVWPTWGLVVIGGAGVVTNQVAYRGARLSASMPVLNIVDGIVALAFGFIVFAEVPRHTPLLLLVEIASLGGVAAGLWLVARLEEAVAPGRP